MGLLGVAYEVMSAAVDERQVTHPNPAVNVVKTAQLKALTIAAQLQGQPDNAHKVIITADTTVALDGQMLGKPSDAADARQMLQSLRNRRHEVHTGVVLLALATGQEVCGVNTAVVTMRNYTDAEIEAYIASGDPLDKAGAYAIQHPVFRPVAQLNGCFTGVMGLSVCHLLQLLPQLGVSGPAELTAVRHAHQQYPCPLYDKIVGKRP